MDPMLALESRPEAEAVQTLSVEVLLVCLGMELAWFIPKATLMPRNASTLLLAYYILLIVVKSIEMQNALHAVYALFEMWVSFQEASVMRIHCGSGDAALLTSKRIQDSCPRRPFIGILPALYQRLGHVGKIDRDRRCARRDDNLLKDIGVRFRSY